MYCKVKIITPLVKVYPEKTYGFTETYANRKIGSSYDAGTQVWEWDTEGNMLELVNPPCITEFEVDLDRAEYPPGRGYRRIPGRLSKACQTGKDVPRENYPVQKFYHPDSSYISQPKTTKSKKKGRKSFTSVEREYLSPFDFVKSLNVYSVSSPNPDPPLNPVNSGLNTEIPDMKKLATALEEERKLMWETPLNEK